MASKNQEKPKTKIDDIKLEIAKQKKARPELEPPDTQQDSGGKRAMNLKKGPTATAQYLQIDYDDLELYERIGRGAYGSVYHALWKSRDKIVAVKKLLQLENEVKYIYRVLEFVNNSTIIFVLDKGWCPKHL